MFGTMYVNAYAVIQLLHLEVLRAALSYMII